MEKNATVVIILLAVAGLLWWSIGERVLSSSHEDVAPTVQGTGVVHHIVLTKDGYSPKESIVGRGDTVLFGNKTGRPFWPASNLHPSHRDYPEFDPKEPIMADETWSFTFTEEGEWKFHDHLAPYFTGTITVE